MSISYFDANAANWDIPIRVERAQTIARALLQEVSLTPDTVVADYGSGTGLLAVALAPHVGHVLALDNSPNMLAMLQEKSGLAGIQNIQGQRFDIDDKDLITPEICDLFVSSMVLHHLRSPIRYAQAAWRALRPGGIVAVIDLDSDDGEFHADHDEVQHHGFDRAALGDLFVTAGFGSARFSTVYTMRKASRSGPERDFTLFMMIAAKPADA